jgi:hypothetical protein
VNLFGFLDSESGVGEAARTLARAIKRTRMLHALVNSPHAPHRRKETQFSKEFAKENPYAVNLIAIYGDMFASEWDYFGEEAFRDRYNIAYWTWELETLPPAWVPLLDRVDEVWAVSSFAARAIETSYHDRAARDRSEKILLSAHAFRHSARCIRLPLHVRLLQLLRTEKSSCTHPCIRAGIP